MPGDNNEKRCACKCRRLQCSSIAFTDFITDGCARLTSIMRSGVRPSLRLTRLLSALTALTQLADARHCAAVSATGDFYAFGTSAGDLSFGNVNSMSTTSSAITLPSTSGRPPFDSNNTQCFTVGDLILSDACLELNIAQGQYTNALYVLDGDSSKLSDVHIYDFAKSSWSVQPTTGKAAGNQVAILVSAIAPHSILSLMPTHNRITSELSDPKSVYCRLMHAGKAHSLYTATGMAV